MHSLRPLGGGNVTSTGGLGAIAKEHNTSPGSAWEQPAPDPPNALDQVHPISARRRVVLSAVTVAMQPTGVHADRRA